MYAFRIIIFLLVGLFGLNASELLKIDGKAVNPACIELMQPWLSEKSNDNVIIKSVVLDTCQNSNLAFKGREPTVNDDGTISYYKDPDDGHSRFAYRYLGKTSKGIHYIFHNGNIGVYSITNEKIISDLQKNTTRNVTVINKLGDSFVPCFQDGVVKNDNLIIKVKAYMPDEPVAFQCSDSIETIILK